MEGVGDHLSPRLSESTGEPFVSSGTWVMLMEYSWTSLHSFPPPLELSLSFNICAAFIMPFTLVNYMQWSKQGENWKINGNKVPPNMEIPSSYFGQRSLAEPCCVNAPFTKLSRRQPLPCLAAINPTS